MKKKRILSIKPEETTQSGAIAREVDINGKMHLFIDFFDEGIWWLRYAFVENDYSRYVVEENKWSVKQGWDLYIENRGYLSSSIRNQKWLDSKSKKDLARWTKLREVDDAIRDIESRIDQYKYKKKNEKETELKQKLFELMPEVADGFFKYIQMKNKAGNLIYYKRQRKFVEFRCAQCGEEWTDDNFVPVKGMWCQCPECKERGKLDWRDRAKVTDIWDFYMIHQSTTDGKLVARCFWSKTRRGPYITMRSEIIEIYRSFIGMKFAKNYYSHPRSGSDERIWNTWVDFKNEIYSSTSYNRIEDVLQETELKYMPLRLFWVANYNNTDGNTGNKLRTVRGYAKCPQLEMLYKMGMDRLCAKIICDDGCSSLINKRGKNVEEILKIKKTDLPYIMEADHDMIHRLQICQYIKEMGIRPTPEALEALEQMSRSWGYSFAGELVRLKTILQYTTIVKAYHYLLKQTNEKSLVQVKTEYIDYLKERAAQGYDMTNTVHLFPKDLHGTYARLRQEAEAKRNAEHDKKLRKRFSKIAEQYKKLSKKYGYQDEVFLVRPAKDVQEIINEGRVLHHCVGSENQSYMENHNKGRSFILFLRKVSEPDVPYATIEIKDNIIRQWYQENDRKPDADIIQPWLDNYVGQLKQKPLKAAV